MWAVIIAGIIAFLIVWGLFRFVTTRLSGGLIPTLLWVVPLMWFTPSGCHHDDADKIKTAFEDLQKQASEDALVRPQEFEHRR